MFVSPQLRFSDVSLSGMCVLLVPGTVPVVTASSVSPSGVPVVAGVSVADVVATIPLVCASSSSFPQEDSNVPLSSFLAKPASACAILSHGREDVCPPTKH